MPMTTNVTVQYEGPPACIECRTNGVEVCSHTGFNPDVWGTLLHHSVLVPGLDPTFTHTVRAVEISTDRKTATLTVETERTPVMELGRNLSILSTPKALVRAVHTDTGEVLAEGGYDCYLQQGQQVWINGEPHLVTAVEHPHRDPDSGSSGEHPDWQVATLQPMPPPEPVQPLLDGSP